MRGKTVMVGNKLTLQDAPLWSILRHEKYPFSLPFQKLERKEVFICHQTKDGVWVGDRRLPDKQFHGATLVIVELLTGEIDYLPGIY